MAKRKKHNGAVYDGTLITLFGAGLVAAGLIFGNIVAAIGGFVIILLTSAARWFTTPESDIR